MKRMQALVLAISAGLFLCFSATSTVSAEEKKTTSKEQTKKKSYKDRLFDDAESYDLEGKQLKKEDIVQNYPLSTRVAPRCARADQIAKSNDHCVPEEQGRRR